MNEELMETFVDWLLKKAIVKINWKLGIPERATATILARMEELVAGLDEREDTEAFLEEFCESVADETANRIVGEG